MPRGPISESHSRNLTITGYTQGCLTCAKVPQTWTDITSVWQNVAPASRSNPVRKDGTRRPSEYSRSVYYANTPTATVFNTPPSPASTRIFSDSSSVGRNTTMEGYFPDTSEAVRMLNDLRLKALSGMSEQNMQFNVAAWEARSTLKSMFQFGQKGVKAIHQMYRGMSDPYRRKYRNVAPYNWRDVPGDYLGYLYGLRPIAEDVENGLGELNGMSKKEMAFGYLVRKSARKQQACTHRVETLGFRVPAVAHGTRSCIARVGYVYQFPQWWIDSVPIVTPFSQMWELTRLSFVLDWAVPIGSWIGAMEASQFDPYFKEGFETWVCNEETGAVVTPVDPQWHILVSGFRNRKYRMVRTTYSGGTSTPHRDGNVRFPSFRKFLNVDRTAQALSLLTQTLKTPPARW